MKLLARDARWVVIAFACVPVGTFAWKMYTDYHAPYGAVASTRARER
jgi:hypothetical protein